MKELVVVFCRAPRLGTVKRRLAAGIGARAALRFHATTLARTLRRLRADRRFRTVAAVTPDRARGPWLQGVPTLPQGAGDLEARMGRVFRRLRHRPVAIVGCDIPDFSPDDAARALRLLRGADSVFGPARDGGYWLVAMGGRRPAAPFARVRWSTPHALADTLANFRGRHVRLLRTLSDVDTMEDFRSVQGRV
jgi:rSAM/selenodomain-associated transferase 1